MSVRGKGGVQARYDEATSPRYKALRHSTISHTQRLVSSIESEQWDDALVTIANMIPIFAELLLSKDEV